MRYGRESISAGGQYPGEDGKPAGTPDLEAVDIASHEPCTNAKHRERGVRADTSSRDVVCLRCRRGKSAIDPVYECFTHKIHSSHY
jgi:hypothetical protein